LGIGGKMSFKIETDDGTEKVPTASKAVEVIKHELSEEGVVRVKVEAETDSPEEITASQAEIEERQRRERASDRD
jgi:hypothetical protein